MDHFYLTDSNTLFDISYIALFQKSVQTFPPIFKSMYNINVVLCSLAYIFLKTEHSACKCFAVEVKHICFLIGGKLF